MRLNSDPRNEKRRFQSEGERGDQTVKTWSPRIVTASTHTPPQIPSTAEPTSGARFLRPRWKENFLVHPPLRSVSSARPRHNLQAAHEPLTHPLTRCERQLLTQPRPPFEHEGPGRPGSSPRCETMDQPRVRTSGPPWSPATSRSLRPSLGSHSVVCRSRVYCRLIPPRENHCPRHHDTAEGPNEEIGAE